MNASFWMHEVIRRRHSTTGLEASTRSHFAHFMKLAGGQ